MTIPAALADPAEVNAGVARLAVDIADGAIIEVVRRYAHAGGDYMLIAATRR